MSWVGGSGKVLSGSGLAFAAEKQERMGCLINPLTTPHNHQSLAVMEGTQKVDAELKSPTKTLKFLAGI